MIEYDTSKEIKSVISREKMIRYLDGYSAERMDELDGRKSKRPLVKSYMLEHVGSGNGQKDVTVSLNKLGIISEQIDDNLYRVLDIKEHKEYMGFLEILTPRYFVFYTLHHSDKSDRWVKNTIFNSSELDHVWLSGQTFNVLWQRIAQLSKPHRYVSIMFVHESIYEIDVDDYEEDEPQDTSLFEKDDITDVSERRQSKFRLVDRISVVQEKLSKLQSLYSPLYAISQLRFPSPIGRGGHDFYDNGKVTNRSDNFRDHRSHILYVQRIYDEMMNITEKKAWYHMDRENPAIPNQFQKLIGAPVSIVFREPLSKETFDHWINSTFNRVNNRFRLWGNPIFLGPKKVHVYGVDKHLWKPIFLELTDKHLVAIIPKGTCGNTVHRLICNVQRYIDPAAEAFVGDIEYKNIVQQSSKGVRYEQEY